MQEKGTISIHTENIFPIIKKFLYSDHEIFLRELVSNAVDATRKIERLSRLGQFAGELGDTTISISIDEKAQTLTVSDRGVGMTSEEIKKYINQIAFSGATEFMEKFKEAQDANEIIGRFGLGFYSAFMVANQVEIQTLSFEEGAEPAHWVCNGSTEFEIKTGSRMQRGTDVILHISEENKEFLEEYRIQQILDKYCRFLPVPIKFGTKNKQVPDGEDKDGKPKYKSVEVDNIINPTKPLWIQAPSELTDEDYLKFYRELYPMAEDPLFWIHLNVDYPFTLTGILYFPKVKNELELQRHKIQLYSRQVFITDEVKDIVPEFLMLLHGVLDSPDIPLNVSRSFLQSDSNVKKITGYISRKVADKLASLFKNERKSYEEKWDHVGLFVKYGMISEEKFAERAKDFTLVKNTEQTYFTLAEYREKTEANQKDKEGVLIYLYANEPEKQHGFIQAANQKGYDVLVLDGPLDSHLISHLESQEEKLSFKRVDAGRIDQLIEKEEKIEDSLNDDQKKSIKDLFGQAINKENMEVELTAGHPDEMPVTITMDEFMRRMKDMAKMGGPYSFYGTMPDRYKVTINGNHKLVQKILETTEEAEKTKLAQQAFDLAMLSAGLLTGEELTRFVNRSVELI